MIVRYATSDDAHSIAENNVALAQESEGMKIDYETAFRGAKMLLKNRDMGFYVVAVDEGKVIGQAMVTYEWSDWRAKKIWWLQSIYVLPEYRERGVMKAIISKIKEMATQQGIPVLRLYVYEKNESAIKAYEAIGMKRADYIMYEMEVMQKTI